MNAVGQKDTQKLQLAAGAAKNAGRQNQAAGFQRLDMRNTVDLLEPYKLKLKPYGSGHAWQQKPPPGSEVLENTTVEVWFN